MSTASPFQSPATIQSLTRWDEDPGLYLFTSLTAGSSHIITATARIGTILKAARIPYVAVDTATDESARKLWGRRAKGKKLPGLVKEGFVIADLEEVEEWNEFGELEDNIGPVPDPSTTSTTAGTGKPLNFTKSSNSSGTTAAAATASTTSSKPPLSSEASVAETTTINPGSSMKLPIRQLADEVAEKATLKNSATSSTKGKGSGPGDEKEEVIGKSDLTSDGKSDVKPESVPEAKPNSISTGGSSGDAAAAVTTTATPATKDETKNKIQFSSDSKNTSSKPEDDHESSLTSKDEYARDAAAKENENENENENSEKSKQSSINEADKVATTSPNSKETQSDIKRDAEEADKPVGGEESKDEAGNSGKNSGEKTEELRDKENSVEARSETEARDKDETVRPQVQDAKSAEAAGVSNMD